MVIQQTYPNYFYQKILLLSIYGLKIDDFIYIIKHPLASWRKLLVKFRFVIRKQNTLKIFFGCLH